MLTHKCSKCGGTGWLPGSKGNRRRCPGDNPSPILPRPVASNLLRDHSPVTPDSPSISAMYEMFRPPVEPDVGEGGWWADPVSRAQASALLGEVTDVIEARHGRAPVVGMDLDGTIADFNFGFRHHVASVRNFHPASSLTLLPDPNAYEYWEGDSAWFADREDFLEHFRDFEQRGGYLRLAPMSGSPEVVAFLRQHGFSVVAFTARDARYNPDTHAWLQHHGIEIERIINAGHDKKPPHGFDVFFDDSPKAVNSLTGAGAQVIVFDQEYNRHVGRADGSMRITDWRSVDFATAIHSAVHDQD